MTLSLSVTTRKTKRGETTWLKPCCLSNCIHFFTSQPRRRRSPAIRSEMIHPQGLRGSARWMFPLISRIKDWARFFGLMDSKTTPSRRENRLYCDINTYGSTSLCSIKGWDDAEKNTQKMRFDSFAAQRLVRYNGPHASEIAAKKSHLPLNYL